ncbi:MAG TPA: glycosyltransferase [Luteibaculaceae bacterium]|nr:glycosyltransferase [Luteibaculaceae bacterium]
MLPIPTIALVVLTVCFIIFFVYCIYFYSRLAFLKIADDEVPASQKVPVTVIICAKNEDENLIKNLPKIFEQDYPTFQVIVVNDGSWDDTKEILEAFQKRYSNLHIINIEENDHLRMGKKLALTLGIKGAKYDHVLVTDADCEPVSNNWINRMATPFARGYSLVLGHSPVKKEAGFLNLLIRFDNLSTAINYHSFSLAKVTYMGVGRNMAYAKKLFFDVGGFKKHYSIVSGDDDLFVNEIASKARTVSVLNPDSITETVGKPTFKLWFRQKQRHYTTVKYYKGGHRTLLAIPHIAAVIFYVAALFLLFFPGFQLTSASMVLGRWLIQIFFNYRCAVKLGHKDVALLSPFLEVVLLVLNPIIYFAQLYNRQPGWR